jgi:hypothetical protein
MTGSRLRNGWRGSISFFHRPFGRNLAVSFSPTVNFPLQIRFKFFALAKQIFVTDASGAQVFYVKQKLFKLREAINIFADESQAQQVASIQADRVLDWSAHYHFTDEAGRSLGGVGRHGMRSLWRAHYEIFDAAGEPAGAIREEKPFIKVLDGLIEEIPFVGVLSAYLFHPSYLLADRGGAPILRLTKRPSLFGRRFVVDQLSAAGAEETRRNVLALFMVVLLERERG